VGFDLYVRMIGEAVSELKGDGPAEKAEVRVERLYPKTVLKPTVRTMLIPVPKISRGGQPSRDTVIGGQPLRDTELLAWCREVIRSVLADLPVGVL
jgi:hypothetical protein